MPICESARAREREKKKKSNRGDEFCSAQKRPFARICCMVVRMDDVCKKKEKKVHGFGREATTIM